MKNSFSRHWRSITKSYFLLKPSEFAEVIRPFIPFSFFLSHSDIVGVEDGVVHLVAEGIAGVEGGAAVGGVGVGGVGAYPVVANKLVAAALFHIAGAQGQEAHEG